MGVEPERYSTITWRKSSGSADQGNCVEVAVDSVSVLVRDSQDRFGSVLTFTLTQWRQLVGRIKGEDSNYG